MQKQVTYYENLLDSFRQSKLRDPSSPNFEILRLETVPGTPQDASYSNPFRLNAFVIGFVTGGRFNLNIANEAYDMRANDVYFTSPWHIRQYSNVDNWKGYLLFFTPDFIFQYPHGEYIFREFRFFHTENGLKVKADDYTMSRLQSQIENMYNLLHSDNPFKMKMLFHLLNIFLYDCKTAFGTGAGQINQGKETTLNNFFQTLNNYFIALNKGQVDKALTLKYVANAMHLHPTYLSNLLKQQTGKTAAQLVRERLILEAQSLLKNTDMTVAEVAYYLHFKDNSNFAKFFRHQVGASPSDYREKAKLNS